MFGVCLTRGSGRVVHIMLRSVLQPIVEFKRDYYYTNGPLQMLNSLLPLSRGSVRILFPASPKKK